MTARYGSSRGRLRRVSSTKLIVGAPAWDRAWCLPLWFQSVLANVDPSETGLVFVVPPADTATREVIEALSRPFAWFEVLRDRGMPKSRSERPGEGHAVLAVARNQILQIVEHVQPRHFVSWDTDMLVPPGTVDLLTDLRLPLVTPWTWLNRQPPRQIELDGQPVLWQDPVAATAMGWDPRVKRGDRPFHYPGVEFNRRASGVWRCGVALAFQLMDQRAYRYARYAPHHDGEDVPFNAMLSRRGVPRFCCGDILGVHLYNRSEAHEVAIGWPGVLRLAQQRPLAAIWQGERSGMHEAAGLYPVDIDDVSLDGLSLRDGARRSVVARGPVGG